MKRIIINGSTGSSWLFQGFNKLQINVTDKSAYENIYYINFIDHSEQPMEDVSFYRKLDPENFDHYNKFLNQTRDPRVALYEDYEMLFGTEDTQPELYAPENRECVEFDKFEGFEKSAEKFKDTLQNFENTDDPFFDSITYGVMFRISEGKVLDKNKAKDVLGKDFYENLLEIKDDIELDKTLFGFFNRSFLANKVLAKYNAFLKFFERRDKFRFLIKKKKLKVKIR